MDLNLTNLGKVDSFSYATEKQVIYDNQEVQEEVNGDLKYANVPNPSNFCGWVKSLEDGQMKKIMDFNRGTTTLGFCFQGGVLFAVDSRASQGNFDASEAVRKIIEINDFLLATMAGGAADCQYWEQYLGVECRKYELKHGERVSVAAASRMLVNIIYGYRNNGLSMGCMLGGFDKSGPNLYYIDNDGTRIKGSLFSVGSGSTYAYGVLDSEYKYDLTLEQAKEVAMKSIYAATYRDAASGGVCRVYHLHKDGWTILEDGYDVNKLHYKYQGLKGFDGVGDHTNAKLY